MPLRRTIRVGVTGLAQAGKTTLLTSLAANLLAASDGFPAMPVLSRRLAGRSFRVRLAPAGAAEIPRFDYGAKLAALDADPPDWPKPTDAVSLLALDIDIGRGGLASALPPQLVRLELLDYPGEWLLDVPMLAADFAAWSRATLDRLATGPAAPIAAGFRAFVGGLPARTAPDEGLAQTGHALFRAALLRIRTEASLPFLQPGRFLMPPPGDPPPWMAFFPLQGDSPLAGLLRQRFERYKDHVRRELISPSFGSLDRLVVLADVLGALHGGAESFGEMCHALAVVGQALAQRNASFLPAILRDALAWLFIDGIRRVAIVATKSDHVAERQRGNLRALVRGLLDVPGVTEAFAVASVRCTEDIVWTLEGRPISAVRGRLLGDERPVRSYPGEVPNRIPDAAFWQHPFLKLPVFEPMRPAMGGRGGVPHIELDALVAFLLEDVLP